MLSIPSCVKIIYSCCVDVSLRFVTGDALSREKSPLFLSP